jgi:hypothetical protein
MLSAKLVFLGLCASTATWAAPPIGAPTSAPVQEAAETPPTPEAEESARSSAPPPAAAEPLPQPEMFFSKGERVFLEEKGFSIIPPVGWEVHKNLPGISLLFQVPKKGVKYQRTIQVVWGQETYAMDEFTEEEFAKTLIERRSKAYGNTGYRLRNKLPITLEDGTKALLYYTEFEYDTFPMMELHILVSSATGHFLMTYTDLAKFFEEQGPDSMLDVAYNSMTSAKLDSKPAGRFDFLIRIGIGIFAFLMFWGVVRFIQGRHSFDDMSDDDGDYKEPKSEVFRAPSGHDDGGEDWTREMSQKKPKAVPGKPPMPAHKPKIKAVATEFGETEHDEGGEWSDEMTDAPKRKPEKEKKSFLKFGKKKKEMDDYDDDDFSDVG